MEHLKQDKFGLDDGADLLLDTLPGVFTPNTTTSIFVKAVSNHLTHPCKLLDLGSGSGSVGIGLALKGLVKPPLFASDISEKSVSCSRKNCSRYDISVEARVGSLLAPWQGEKFDCIADTVSGIAQEAARLSPWYSGVSCDAGEGGIKLTTEILRQAPDYLNEGGQLFFPVISLSNVDKALAVARENFRHVEFLAREEWPLPTSMYDHMEALDRLKEEGNILLDKKFGMVICFTDIYVAFNQ